MAALQQIPAALLTQPDWPPVAVNQRVGLDCGCGAYVGRRIDNGEAAVCAFPCDPAHLRRMEHFNLLMRESLVEPTGRLLTDVVSEMLDQAERYA